MMHDVTLLDRAVGARARIKATGGIRFFEDAVAMLEAGASRLGASRTEATLGSRVDHLGEGGRRPPDLEADQPWSQAGGSPAHVHVAFISVRPFVPGA
jgi:hypothetical protein